MSKLLFEKFFETYRAFTKKAVFMAKITRQTFRQAFENVSTKFETVLDTHTKKIWARCGAAFCAGVLVSCVCVGIARNAAEKKGIGGLETDGVPEYTEDMLDGASSAKNSGEAKDNYLDTAAALLQKENGVMSHLS